MPRNVRNFWLELRIDGRTTRIACGPQARTGGFELRILQRAKGDIIEALDVWGVEDSGSLALHARYGKGADTTTRAQTLNELCADELTIRTER